MSSPMILKVSQLEKSAGFHLPTSQADIVTPDSPAIEVMTDLKQIVAATVGADVLLSHANHLMISRGVRSLLLVRNRKFLSLAFSHSTNSAAPGSSLLP